jgi:hypothetical protein
MDARDVHAALQKSCSPDVVLPREQLENIMLQNCYVRASDDANHGADATFSLSPSSHATSSPTAPFPVPDSSSPAAALPASVPVSGAVRATAFDALFGDNADGFSVAQGVVQALKKCAIDARPGVVKNVVLAGGLAGSPGFAKRLLQEVDVLMGADPTTKGMVGKLKLFKSPFAPASVAFSAASLLGCIDMGGDRFIKPEHCTYGKPLPIGDWTAPATLEEAKAEDEEEGEEEEEEAAVVVDDDDGPVVMGDDDFVDAGDGEAESF